MTRNTWNDPASPRPCDFTMKTAFFILLLLFMLQPEKVVSAPTQESEPADEGLSSSSPSIPVFTNEKEDLLRRLSAAHTIELSCKARGSPRPSVVWYKNGEELLKLPPRRYEIVEIRKWVMRIKNAIPDDDGQYTCVVDNGNGKIQRTFDVKVIPRIVAHKPVIGVRPDNQTLLLGEDLLLHCEPDLFDVSSPPMITFIKHGVSIDGSPLRDENNTLVVETLQTCSIRGVCEMQDSDNTYNVEDPTVLHLRNMTIEDSGWYTCTVENELGMSAASGYISVISEFPIDPNIVETENQKRNLIIGAVTVVPLAILGVSCTIFFFCRWKKEEARKMYAADAFKHVYQWTKVVLVEKQQNAHNAEPLLDPIVTIQKKKLLPAVGDDCPETEYELAPDPLWEIDRNDLHFENKTLGEGAFGKVVLAHSLKPLRRWRETGQTEEARMAGCPVAVKMLKECHSDGDLMDLVKEMEIMKAIGFHPNIVNLLGVSTQPTGKPLLLIIEFAENGNLKDYLVSHRPPSSPTSWSSWNRDEGYECPISEDVIDLKLMLKMAFEVAKGMEFLSSKKCVHRDLAARNVLVTKDLQVKISDFGMARDIKTSEYYRKVSGGRVPLKWMAPEAVFEQVSTTKSDVWSFGILLYEIVTLGDSPYKNVIIDNFLEQLRVGTRMEQPVNCPDNVYEVMFDCWRMMPEARPEWSQLVNTLRNLYADAQPLVYLDMSFSAPVSPRRPVY